MVKFVGTLTDESGRKFNATIDATEIVTPPPVETGIVIPDGANVVRIGNTLLTLTAIDPTTTAYPGGRGPHELVVYTSKVGAATKSNKWGPEIPFGPDGKALPMNDREIALIDLATPIPVGGVVVSAHGNAGSALRSAYKEGVTVSFEKTAIVIPPVTPPTPSTKTHAVYVMDGVGYVSQVPAPMNQIRTAFLQEGGLVEWGGDSPEQYAASITAWCKADASREHLVSIGGENGSVSMGKIVGAMQSIGSKMPTHGIDWDVEKGALDIAQSVAVSKACAAGKTRWLTGFTPPGGTPVAAYLEAAKLCQQAGLRVQFGQQLYATEINLSAVMGAIQRAVGVLGAPSVVLGCMVGPNPKFSTVAQWEAYMKEVYKKWPDIGGWYLWESARSGTADLAAKMKAILG